MERTIEAESSKLKGERAEIDGTAEKLVEKLSGLLDWEADLVLSMATELSRKGVNWARVQELGRRLDNISDQYIEGWKTLQERLRAKKLLDPLQRDHEDATGGDLSCPADPRDGSDLSGRNAAMGVALL